MAWRSPAWRGLGLFWAAVLVLAGAGAATLQALGPVTPPPASHGEAAPVLPAPPVAEHAPVAPPPPEQHAEIPPRPAEPPRVASPDPALLERSGQLQLPRIGADGRLARVVYAAPVPRAAAGLPRVALLLAGFGQSEKDSRATLESLPGAVSFAVSAYAGVPSTLYDAARLAGHELLASVPMEPAGFPLNDAGSRQLLTGLPPEENRRNLEWALARLPGAVGATGASDGMRGERFADIAGALTPALDEIARRGLLYVDPRPGRATARPGLAVRAVDVVLDESPARAEIEARLVALERVAREKGSAIGLAGPPKPVTLERIAAWTQTLEARGLVLVPVSALIGPPP